MRTVMLFDNDQLAGMRRVFNRVDGCKAAVPNYFETPWRQRILRRAHARRVIEAAKTCTKAITGHISFGRCSPVKLAIIRKR